MFKNFRSLGAAFEAGKTWISTFRKVPAATATVTGQWFDYGYAAGNPIPNYYAASPLVAAVLESDKGIIVPRMKVGERQWLHRFTLMSAGATSSTQPFYLNDYLLFYPFVDMDAAGEDQVMDNTVTLPRYSDGVGVQMMVVAQSATVAPKAAHTPLLASPSATPPHEDASDHGTQTAQALQAAQEQQAQQAALLKRQDDELALIMILLESIA